MVDNLIILAGGASSRMKKNTSDASLSKATIQQANTRSKGLIEIGDQSLPFSHYLLYNAKEAGYKTIYFVIGEKDILFQEVYGEKEQNNEFKGLKISFVRQYIPEGRTKPYGTADAVLQALEQYPILKESTFVVCNCDNLYSQKVFESLRQIDSKNALMGYDRDGLLYPLERIAKFALMKIDPQGYLLNIIEKPSSAEADNYYDLTGKLRVSMNIFKFDGRMFYQFLKDCPVNPERKEKELPTALLNMVKSHPHSVKVIPLSEHVIDLTSKDDIGIVNEYLKEHYSNTLKW